MKVLIICSKRSYAPFTNYMAPFIYEQMEDLRSLGIVCEASLISGGIRGYIKAIADIRKTIRRFSPDILHAHYGLCGVIANTQRKVPVVTTFHGSDLNNPSLRFVSFFSQLFSRANIVVSDGLFKKTFFSRKTALIPCGINSRLLTPMSKGQARDNLGWESGSIYVLFSKEFYNKEKNYPLAKAAIEKYIEKYSKTTPVHLMEFIGYSREEVHWLYNAVDCVIMTSHHEGSPQFIKEAMSCNCPVVSVDVGDVKQVISGVEGCYMAERTPEDLADKLHLAISHGKTCGRDKVCLEFDSLVAAQRIVGLYESILGHE